ncbi:MAG: hypothetical protein M3N98_16525, partial [Actinomycetota bacterium]|nr:hypothetical protein [Actinomycetota bacterium]
NGATFPPIPPSAAAFPPVPPSLATTAPDPISWPTAEPARPFPPQPASPPVSAAPGWQPGDDDVLPSDGKRQNNRIRFRDRLAR